MKRLGTFLAIGLLCSSLAYSQSITPNTSSSSSGSAPCSTFGTTAGTCAQGNDSRFTTAAIAAALAGTTACTSWTPTDQSGASLTFTSVSAMYCQIGNMVFAYGTLTYPSTVDATNAKISLPIAVPNQPYAAVSGLSGSAAATSIAMRTIINSSTAAFFTSAGVQSTNAQLTLQVLHFILIYPAS